MNIVTYLQRDDLSSRSAYKRDVKHVRDFFGSRVFVRY